MWRWGEESEERRIIEGVDEEMFCIEYKILYTVNSTVHYIQFTFFCIDSTHKCIYYEL